MAGVGTGLALMAAPSLIGSLLGEARAGFVVPVAWRLGFAAGAARHPRRAFSSHFGGSQAKSDGSLRLCTFLASCASSRGACRIDGRFMKQNAIRVVVVDDNAVRAAILVDGLREAGIDGVEVIEASPQLVRRLAAIDPDVIIIDLENPSRDMLEQMFQVSRVVSRPVAMFVDRSDQSMIRAAVDAGVSAYIVDGLKKERVKAIVDMAISRFEAFDRLQRELVEARSELADRKLIDRAKGILMRSRNLSEEEAYALLRQAAMNEKRRIAEIAQSLVTAAGLLGK
jgi:response regulator NasT